MQFKLVLINLKWGIKTGAVVSRVVSTGKRILVKRVKAIKNILYHNKNIIIQLIRRSYYYLILSSNVYY